MFENMIQKNKRVVVAQVMDSFCRRQREDCMAGKNMFAVNFVGLNEVIAQHAITG